MKIRISGLRLAALIVFVGAFFVSALFSSPSDSSEASKVMHGIRRSDFGDFEKKWKLVTVRFRKDTSELRFTYANDVAWKHLKKLTQKNASASSDTKRDPVESYPAGAVFAKVGIATAEDPAFVSSAVPSGVRRVQFMVRNEKKFAETEGWGYALFDASGNTFPGDLKQASMACAACHKIVPDRGYVFSQFMTGLAPTRASVSELGRILFEIQTVRALPEHVQLQLPPKAETVSVVTGEITKHVFPGTLDEIRPLLTKEAVRTGGPAMLLTVQNGSPFYSIVYSTKTKGSCAEAQLEFLGVMNTTANSATTQTIRFCESDKK